LLDIKLVADLHVHTIASGHAYSTVAEVIEAASQRGLEALALTDHGPSMPGGPYRYYFGNLFVIPEREKNVEILKGVEANIIDRDGTLDLPDYYLEMLDIVWAGLHVPCLQPASRDLNTEALLNALKNPYVDGIVHPGNPDFSIDEEAVVQAAQKEGKLLEINNSSFIIRRGSKTRCLDIARLVQRYDGLVALNSDAHIAKDVGNHERALKLALDAGLSSEQIINTDWGRVKDFLKARGKKRFQN
jgi:putative hydrolase